jgi:F420H(2)-dependent quinone reductase
MAERIKTRIEHLVDTRSARFGAGLLRLTKGRIARLWRRQVLVLTTRGRRSGKERTVPLQYFPDGQAMVVVAANSGLASPPGWYFNPGLRRSRSCTMLPGCVVGGGIAQPTGAAGVGVTWQPCWVVSSWW